MVRDGNIPFAKRNRKPTNVDGHVNRKPPDFHGHVMSSTMILSGDLFNSLRPPGAARYWDTMEWSKDRDGGALGSDPFGAMLGPGKKISTNANPSVVV